ncbi:MAG TPA: lipoprotein-releasing ABC transporter permease subunit [Longimicrobiales bacterium]|nr:lipoprotein-releasing ABC transporter permease subunit [Longimicrobiales bacterium]
MRLSWYIARRNLAARRRGRFLSLITWISVGGIAVGVAALIVVIAVMTGLQRDLHERILGSNPHVYVFEQGRGFRMHDWRTVLERVNAVEGVENAAPFIMTQVAAVVGEYAQPGVLYGIDPTRDGEAMTDVEAQIRAGEITLGPTTSGNPGLVLGSRLADKLGVHPGDVITLLGLETVRTGALGDLVPVMRPFEVSGVFTTGMYDYDTQNMYAELSAAQSLLDLDEETVGGIAVNVSDPWRAPEVGDALQRELGFPYWTSDWMTLNRSLFSALQLEKFAMGIILFLIVIVAAFNIVSTLIMVVTDKTREIGILKAMGMADGVVLRVFMMQGLAIGLLGTLIGAPIGFLVVWLQDHYGLVELQPDVYFIDTLPVTLDPVDVLVIVGISVLIAFAATIYPARQASRLAPVESIRHD